MLQVEAAASICLAAALAVPVTDTLARARWPARSPRVALILWQAVGLGGGLGILGAGLTLAAGSLARGWLDGIAAIPDGWPRLGPEGWIGIVLAAAMGGWLLAAAALSAGRVMVARRAHRVRLDTVAAPWSARVPVGGASLLDVRLVEHPDAVAYCLPGLRPRVVVSRGALDTLSGGELMAVLAHERAHARGRHDLVIQPFVAWRGAFPWLPSARRAVAAVELLVELLADDAARDACGPGDLSSAVRHLAAEHRARAGRVDPHLEGQLAFRTARLQARPRPLPTSLRSCVYVAALALVVLPPVILALS